ncbi:MAG: hypothetical protein WEA29_09820 [Acidimicrobiia bacterium]
MPELRLDTASLHIGFLEDLGDLVLEASAVEDKPLEVSLSPPLPERVRAYIYNLTSPPGGRPTGEHKIQLIAPGQGRGERGTFDFSDDAFVLLAGFSPEDGVYVLWDAPLHNDFSWSANVQVRGETIESALAEGLATQDRQLRSARETERVVVVPRGNLVDGLIARVHGSSPMETPDSIPPAMGASYRQAAETSGASKRRVFEVDPDLFDRATDAHARTQNALKERVLEAGLEPRSPAAADPQFDLAWVDGDVAHIVEVKSLTEQNETRQMRYAIGQVLSYCAFLRWPVSRRIPVIALERRPSADEWAELCAAIGIRLVWPDTFGELFN